MKKLAILAVLTMLTVFISLGGGVVVVSHTSHGTIYVDDDNCLGQGKGMLAK